MRCANKGLDDIRISKIFHFTELLSLLPETLQNDKDIPTYTNEVRSNHM